MSVRGKFITGIADFCPPESSTNVSLFYKCKISRQFPMPIANALTVICSVVKTVDQDFVQSVSGVGSKNFH